MPIKIRPMKNSFTYKLRFFLSLLILTHLSVRAANFTSAANNVAWNLATSWTYTGTDVDGIPDGDDNVVIQAGHQINLVANVSVTSITINGTLNLGTSSFVNYGNYTLSASGTMTSSLAVIHSVRGVGKSFTVAGAYGSLIKLDFVYNTSITSSTSFTFSNSSTGSFSVRTGVTISNSGTVNISNTALSGGGTWNNLSGSSLILGKNPTITTLNASAVSNTVTYNAGATAIKAPVSSYNNLIINGNKTIPAALIVSGNLTVNSGTTNFQNFALTLGGNLSNSGTISNMGTATFSGTSAQSVSSSTSITFSDFICSNAAGVSITSGNDTITNSLTVSSGNLNVGANLITLKSNATKTAYIASSAGTISGSMIIQRYIAARSASYSDFSSPVQTTTIDDWDDELYMTINAPNDVAGYPGGDGMASPPNTFYSVTVYNNATNWWDSIVTGATLQVGKGYDMWIADDATSFPGRAIDTRGTPNMGTPSYNATYATGAPYAGWNLIGNPHASWISWADVVAASSNVQTWIQIYNNGTYVDDLTQPDIAPGQGFFCEVTANTSVNFPQSAKRANTSSTFLRTIKPKDYDLKLRLSSSANAVYHEININYENNSSSKFEQGKDIPFIKSPRQIAPSITFVDGEKKFIRNRISPDENMQVLPLEISTPVAGTYNIDLEGLLSNTVYSEAYLLNASTKEELAIDDTKSISVYFEAGQLATNYSLVLKKSNISSLPVSDEISIFSTSESINIKGNYGESQNVNIQVYNIVGQLVLTKTAELTAKGLISLPTSELNSDVYVVKVTAKNNQQFTDKVVVTK